MRVLEGIAGRRPTALEEAYQVFRLERQGNLVAPRTLEFYDRRIGELIAWLRSEAPTVERVEDVGVNHLRAFRAFMTERRRPDGQPLQAATLHASRVSNHTLIATMFFGSVALAHVGIDWTPSSLDIAMEVQDNDDQGDGGYDNQQTFTNPAWYDGTNTYRDALGLTPNNVVDQNETANPPWAIPSHTQPANDWLRLTIAGSGFSTYDTACRV